MKCPKCLFEDTKVIDSREVDEKKAIRRRRECLKCKHRYTTYEKVELLNLLVIKKDGTREVYDRNKLLKGIQRACEKRQISQEQIDDILNKIERKIQSSCDNEVRSKKLGELVMCELKKIDKVAYIRFASVYKEFADVVSFEEELKRLRYKKRKK